MCHAAQQASRCHANGARPLTCAGQLEGPQEVGAVLEVGAHVVELGHEVLHADDAVLAQVLHA